MNGYRYFDFSSDEEEDEDYVVLKKIKVYQKREQCFTKYDEKEFFDRFRLRKQTVVSLLCEIEDMIAHPTNRGGAIPPMQQLLLSLRFFATGNFLITAGDFMGISKTSTCRIIRNVSRAIASLRPRYINMYSTIAEMESAARGFYKIASFPRVIGAIDCTLIKIDSVGGLDAEIYRCRKNYFALNVQTVCDANLRIRNIVARWPGSAHDQTVFNNSNLKEEFSNGIYNPYMLVGDSGYRLETYLMTKLRNVTTAEENLYNESIIRTRNVVERKYGVWKRRFPILSLGMRVNLDTVMAIVVATAVLHNIAIDMNDEYLPEWLGEEEEDENNENRNIQEAENGNNVRRLIINNHFANL